MSDWNETVTLPSPPRCEFCIHWQPLQFEVDQWGDLSSEEHYYEIGVLAQRDRRSDEVDAAPWGKCGYPLASAVGDRMAYTVDGSDFFSALVTRRDFACIAFSPKDTGATG